VAGSQQKLNVSSLGDMRRKCGRRASSSHFNPTYSSWLNQMDVWFSKIERDLIARRVFTSVADLRHKLMKYIEAYTNSARPIRWTYTDPKHRIRVFALIQSPGRRPKGNQSVHHSRTERPCAQRWRRREQLDGHVHVGGTRAEHRPELQNPPQTDKTV
jgi:hypothetical protein